ncbi:MAG: hypothetical protein HWN81_01300 [Candidatus Lokiarchaeota archaeon]|nr:hypothetical protein [Candidatus Lokiarchaeota archaeon]
MITTRESISYQFSLIFGYSSPNDVIAGDVIGPGRLTRKKVNKLSQEVIKFLTMYNAILRDYTGAELFSIEFDLYNIDEKSARTNIYPQSMIFIPGKFKECESLLLALKPETGVLDIHKSRESLNNISKLFFEVEELSNRPELKKENKQLVFNKFASRFSKKLYGELIEDKWNKKLIGLSKTLPTEKEMLNTYVKVISNVEILWYKKPMEINFLNPKFQKIKIPFEGQQAIEHLKFSISEPSIGFIVDKTLNLGTNLINLANTGTLDESLDEIIIFIVNYIEDKIKDYSEPNTAEWLISSVNKFLIDLEGYLNKFLEYSRNFLSTGEMGDLDELLSKYVHYISNKGKLESEEFENICNIAKEFIEQTISQKKSLRIIELSSVFNYFTEIINKSLNIIRISLPRYLSYRRLKSLTIELMKNLHDKFVQEQKPAKILGQKIISDFKSFLFNQIETHSILLEKNLKYNEKDLIKEFYSLSDKNIDPFFNKIELKIENLVSFAEIQMESDITRIRDHIEKFKKFSKELNYLLSYVLRHSTINRYIKEEPDKEISDPVTFSNRFHRFLEKRIGGINLEWKFYILNWIKDYSRKYLKPEEQRRWTLAEVYNDFIEYFEERELKERKIENFLKFLNIYIAKIQDPEQKNLLLEFYKKYELSIEINIEFPKYVKNHIKSELNNLNPQIENTSPFNYFSLDEAETFYNYIKNTELKYFSKLIPRPLNVILKHTLTNEEKELFKGDLFHIIDFKFWHNNVRFELSDNFKEVYREWVSDL